MGIGDTLLELFRPFPPDAGFVREATVGKQDTEGTGYWRVGVILIYGQEPTRWLAGGFRTYQEAENWADNRRLYQYVRIEFQEKI